MDSKNIEAVKTEQYIHLTTQGRRTGKPHTVQLWFAFEGGKIYLSHEGEYTDWMKNITKHWRVAVKIDSVSFDAAARILKEGSSKELGKKALYEKYYKPASKEVIDDWFSLSTLIEVEPIG